MKWIPIKDRLPEEGQKVLVYRMTLRIDLFVYYGRQSPERPWWSAGAEYSKPLEHVTHWMPLPDPPTKTIIVRTKDGKPASCEVPTDWGTPVPLEQSGDK